MYRANRLCTSLLSVIGAASALAQAPAEGQGGASSGDPDEAAAQELVREFRQSPRERPTPDISLEELFANSSSFYGEALAQCEVDEAIQTLIDGAEQRLDAMGGQTAEPAAEVDELRSQLMQLWRRAFEDCCDRSEIVCSQ